MANASLRAGDTVYIRQGTYNETIAPAHSGAAGSSITYACYPGDTVVITGVTDGVDLRNRHYIVLDGLRIEDVQRYWVNMNGDDSTHSSTHNAIVNCHMEGSRGGWAGIYMEFGVDWNRIIGCTFIGICGPDTEQDAAPADLLYCRGGAHYNLIENNRFFYGSHQCMDFQGTSAETAWNIIRNNEFSNPWHTSLGVDQNADWTLVEGNVIVDSGADYQSNLCGSDRDQSMPRKDHKGLQLGSSNCVVRNNVLINNGQMSMSSYERARCLDNRVYLNTFYANYVGIETNTTEPVNGNVIKNNVFFDQVQYDVYHWADDSAGKNRFINNSFTGTDLYYHPDGKTSLEALESDYPEAWGDDTVVTPGFIDASGRDLRLASDSPLIDAGAFLTAATSSGSGTLIPVEDASYFYDGWGIPGEQGDLIQLQGQTETARIVSIDYDNNRITVDGSLSWSAGQGVSLPYHGSAPDVGAFEYASSGPTTYTLSTSGSHGSIAKSPNQSSYNSGTTVTIQATADDGYEFTGWSGDLSGSTNPAMVTMDGNKSITANFVAVTPTTYTLATSGTNGWIAKSPDRSTYDSGTTVTLQANADGGYEFTGWSGDLSGSANPATITMDGNKFVGATFAAVASATHTLSVSGTNGSVAKTPDKTSYTQGETVTLTATPSTGYSFANWSGDASGTSSSTTVTMDGNKSVTANFSINSYTLTADGTHGSVAKTPDKSTYTYGETVTVTASPDTGYGFAGWSGDLSGGTNPATITMDTNKSIGASFTRQSADAEPPKWSPLRLRPMPYRPHAIR